MALIEINGFDVDDHAQRMDVPIAGNSVGTIFTDTRFGVGGSFGISTAVSGNPVARVNFAPVSKMILGMAMKCAAGNDSTAVLAFYGDNGTTLHCQLRLNTNGSVALLRGSTVLATSVPGIISFGSWHYIEVSLTVSDTVGVFTVRVDEVVVATFTGDTKNAGTAATIDRWALQQPNTIASSVRIDDYYLCDGTGATNNDFLGDRRVQTVFPSGAGNSTGLTPVGSSSNWENVDESTLSAVDYNYSTTPGAKDTYVMGDLAVGTASVNAVQVVANARKSDAGSRSLKNVLRSGGVDYAGTAQALNGSGSVLKTIHAVDPATSAAWTVAAVNAAEAGVEVV
jgi:hypothetical protein